MENGNYTAVYLKGYIDRQRNLDIDISLYLNGPNKRLSARSYFVIL